ncbi:MAG: hypothetical protein ACE5GX_04200 [Thermoanaerobaculia bacterium]
MALAPISYPVLAPTQLGAYDFGPGSLGGLFEEVEQVSVYRCGICMPWRDNAPIYVARGPKADFREYWEEFKHFE